MSRGLVPLIGSHSWLGRSVVIDTILNLSVPEVHLKKRRIKVFPVLFTGVQTYRRMHLERLRSKTPHRKMSLERL